MSCLIRCVLGEGTGLGCYVGGARLHGVVPIAQNYCDVVRMRSATDERNAAGGAAAQEGERWGGGGGVACGLKVWCSTLKCGLSCVKGGGKLSSYEGTSILGNGLSWKGRN